MKVSLRFIFVRSSMQVNIQTVLKRTSFSASFLCFGTVLIFANLAFYFHEQSGKLSITVMSHALPLCRQVRGRSAPAGSVPGLSRSLLLFLLCQLAERDAREDDDDLHHEHHQHHVQLLSLHVPGGEEKREHR